MGTASPSSSPVHAAPSVAALAAPAILLHQSVYDAVQASDVRYLILHSSAPQVGALSVGDFVTFKAKQRPVVGDMVLSSVARFSSFRQCWSYYEALGLSRYVLPAGRLLHGDADAAQQSFELLYGITPGAQKSSSICVMGVKALSALPVEAELLARIEDITASPAASSVLPTIVELVGAPTPPQSTDPSPVVPSADPSAFTSPTGSCPVSQAEGCSSVAAAGRAARSFSLAQSRCLLRIVRAWRFQLEHQCARHSLDVLVCGDVAGTPSVLVTKFPSGAVMPNVLLDPLRADTAALNRAAESVMNTMFQNAAEIFSTRSAYSAASDYCVRASAVVTDAGVPMEKAAGAWVWIPVATAASPSKASLLGLTPVRARAVRAALLNRYPAVRAQLGSVLPPAHLVQPTLDYTPAQTVVTNYVVHPTLPSADDAVQHWAPLASTIDAMAKAFVAALPLEQGGVHVDRALLDRLCSKARSLAAARGAQVVGDREVREAVTAVLGPDALPGRSPAADIPQHYESMLASIRSLASRFASASSHWGQSRRPRVLIAYEKSAVVASLFKMAGADVATCDLKPSENSEIPHFQGDAAYILDLGWDLIIAHPPCTYLSNAGVQWLHKEPDRFARLLETSHEYRRVNSARCPLIACENPIMHIYAKTLTGRKVSQYVQPYHHGTGHTKATGLDLKGLPLLQPTCVVEGREHAMARLPPSADRAEKRSQTYLGIAGAMVLQWMPCVMDSVMSQPGPSPLGNATELVRQATEFTKVQAAKVCFYHRKPDGQLLVYSYARKGDASSFDVLGGTRDSADETIGGTLKRELMEELNLPPGWLALTNRVIEAFPLGHASCTCNRYNQSQLHKVHVWAVPLSQEMLADLPEATPRSLTEEIEPGTLAMRPLFEVTSRLQTHLSLQPYGEALTSAVDVSSSVSHPTSIKDMPAARVAAARLPATMRPWDFDRLPLDKSPPQPTTVKHRWGKWRAWASNQWVTLSGQLQCMLDESLRPARLHQIVEWDPVKPMEWEPTLTGTDMTSEYSTSSSATVWNATPRPRVAALDIQSLQKSALIKQIREDWDHSERLVEVIGRQLADPWLNQRTVLSEEDSDTLEEEKSRQTHFSLEGASSAPSAFGWLQQLRQQRRRDPQWNLISAARVELNKFVKGEVINQNPSLVAALPAATTGDQTRRPCEVGLDDTGETFTEDEIQRPVAPVRTLSRNSLYIPGLTVCRHAPTRKGKPQVYRVDHALVAPQALQDTGAGPSYVTDGLLSALPADACVSRNPHACVGNVLGPNGDSMSLLGTATLVFDIQGVKFRQEFVVGRGAPILILGNDWSDAYKAQLSLNTDGLGAAEVVLRTAQGDCHVALSTRRDVQQVALVQPHGPTGDSMVPRYDHSADHGATGATAGATVVEALPTLSAPDSDAQSLVDAAVKVADPEEYYLYTGEAVLIPGRSKATIWLAAPLDLRHEDVRDYLVRSLPNHFGIEKNPPMVVPAFVQPNKHNLVPVVVWNEKNRARSLPAFSPVAQLEVGYTATQLPTQEGPRDYVKELSPEHLKLLDSIDIDKDADGASNNQLSAEQLERVRQMLAKHIRAFAVDPKDPRHTHLMEVQLPLVEGAKPHRHPPAKLGEAGREIVSQQIAELEAAGIIRKSNSEWNTRIVLVGKKGGQSRMCLDMRALNAKLVTLDTPIPLTVDSIERLAGGAENIGNADSLFLSCLDLASGFWTLPIAESDKKLTAFSDGRQKYEWNYLPFGVQSGPSYMCRLMEAALDGLAGDIVHVYLDDAGMSSTGTGDTLQERIDTSFEQMLFRLELVLDRFEKAGMTCKASKCKVFTIEAEYLGHLVSREGIKMDPKKIDTISKVDPRSINSIEKVRSFLGLCGYYRRFVRHFAKLAAPLNELTKKLVDVYTESQSDQCQAAIKALIEAITSEPVLAPPKFDRPFTIKTDAAGTEGLGGILTQLDDEGHERVVAYYGRKLNKHERNYTVTEIECLAALESIKQWRSYVWGRKFHLVIDHSALAWLHSMKDTIEGGPASRLMRWILKLQEYNFTIEHKPGVAHKDADGVSRIVAPLRLEPSLARIMGALRCEDAKLAASFRRSVERRPAIYALVSLLQSKVVKPPAQVAAILTARSVQKAEREARNANLSKAAVIHSYLKTETPDWATLLKAQDEDPECCRLKCLARNGDFEELGPVQPDYARWLVKQASWLELNEHGILQKRAMRHERGDVPAKPYIPSELRWPFMTAFHDRLGHPGTWRMQQILRKRYYWPNMTLDIKQYVAECHECTLGKRHPRRAANPKGPPIGSYPFDLLYCDVVSMAPTHDYVEGGTGYSKMLTFVDSLSRWVEAIPFNKDPTSEQVLDAFMTSVVARHGAPREIRSDLGSNVSGLLCQTIYEACGVSLQPSAANAHDAVGMVERVQQTITNMAKVSDEGGAHWASHLPFLLMSYHATPHRLTEASPASLLYGRELRLPAQIPDPGSTSAPVSTVDPFGRPLPAHMLQYARKLHEELLFSWHSAYDATGAAQGAAISDTHQHTLEREYSVGDRVVRLLYDKANKLQYDYAGPYRITAKLDNGRYVLSDLENNRISEEFDAHNLRIYRTWVDAEELQPDEYLVERIIGHRDDRGARELRVKWRGYPSSKATWEPRREISRRCAQLVADYESDNGAPLPLPSPPAAVAAAPIAVVVPPPAAAVALPPDHYTSDDLPCEARFERGKWSYGRWMHTPRGKKLRMFHAKSFTAAELASVHFQSLRDTFTASRGDQPATIAIISFEDFPSFLDVSYDRT